MCNVFVICVMFWNICNVCNRTLTVMCLSRQTGRSMQRRNTKSWWQRKAQTTRKKCNPAIIISLFGVYFGFKYFVQISRLVSPELFNDKFVGTDNLYYEWYIIFGQILNFWREVWLCCACLILEVCVLFKIWDIARS